MKKRSCSSNGSQKSLQSAPKRDKKFINFDYTNNLQCFITSSSQLADKHIPKNSRKEPILKTNPADYPLSTCTEKKNSLLGLRVPRKFKGKISSNSHNTFDNKLFLLEYQGQQLYKMESKQQIEGDRPRDSPKSDEEDQVVTQIVNSCMRVITEDTQHSSNPISARYTSLSSSNTPNSMSVPMMMPMGHMYPEDYYYYMGKAPAVRNRRAIGNQQSRVFVIDIQRAQMDGRTTIMIRNIPNKYTQDMLLQLFEKNHKKKFDFFYLPIDYNNNCNVGYAFLNFIHTKFIADFYREFHQRKWNKFNSVKVCQVCYARIQGTAQLENHFQHSNVLQQKDRRFRPLIGLKTLQENISHLLQKQKNQHSEESEQY